MFTADDFRNKAAECAAKVEGGSSPGEIRDLRRLEQSFLSLASNEDWLAANLNKIVHSQDVRAAERPEEAVDGEAASEVEEHVLRCLGAAVILQWGSIPAKLQRELFDSAGSMGDLMRTPELRGQIARFVRNQRRAFAGEKKYDRVHGTKSVSSLYTASPNVWLEELGPTCPPQMTIEG